MYKRFSFIISMVSIFSFLLAGEVTAKNNASFFPKGSFVDISQANSIPNTNWACVGSGEPNSCHKTLMSISMISASNAWAVGDNGVILHWDGTTWADVIGPNNLLSLESVDMVSSSDGWALGYNTSYEGILLRWDGEKWFNFAHPENFYGKDVHIFSANAGWIVGWGEQAYYWNGSDWTGVALPRSATLNSVDMVSANDGWAVGNEGDEYSNVIFRWNGSNWSEVISPTGFNLFAVDMVSSTDGWAVGNWSTILHWDGTSWNIVQEPNYNNGSNYHLHSLKMLSATNGWAVGGGPLVTNGTILHWNGTEWSAVAIPVGYSTGKHYISSVDFVSASSGWAVGDNGAIYKWDGNEWSLVFGSGILLDIEMLTSDNGWAVGERADKVSRYGTVSHWDGTGWTVTQEITGTRLSAIDMVSSMDGWAVGEMDYGYIILRWNGIEWVTFTTTYGNVGLYDVDMVSSTDGWAVGFYGYGNENSLILHWDGTNWNTVTSPSVNTDALYGLDMLSANDGWAVGWATIMHWDGVNWTTIPTSSGFPVLYDVAMISPNDGWAVGIGGQIIHWDGATWTPYVLPFQGYFYDLDMVSGSDGWLVGGYTSGNIAYGVLLHWDGTSWTMANSYTPEYLRAVDMISSNEIWAAGEGELVLKGVADSDSDGIPDDVEINGYDFNGDGTIDINLADLGAKWNHKDVFVQVDWIEQSGLLGHSHKPGDDSMDLVKQAFANAPVSNPDGSTGINLHIVFGQKIEESDQNRDLGSVINNCDYVWDKFQEIKNTNLPPEKWPIFHYVIFAHSLPVFNCVGGRPSGISRNGSSFTDGSSDFIVSLGGSWEELLVDGGIKNARAGTFMHELGHNLGLGHGGLILDLNGNVVDADHTGYKPNYLSVMNYSFQTRGLRKKSAFFGLFSDGFFDYSRFGPSDLPDLDENDLSEPLGFEASDAVKDFGTRYYCQGSNNAQTVDGLQQSVDWNCNGNKTDTGVSASINRGTDKAILRVVNEWEHLNYKGGTVGTFGVPVELPTTTSMAISPEITYQEDSQIAPFDTQMFIYLPFIQR